MKEIEFKAQELVSKGSLLQVEYKLSRLTHPVDGNNFCRGVHISSPNKYS